MNIIKNMGVADRLFRLILSCLLIYIGLYKPDLTGHTIVNNIIVIFGGMNVLFSIFSFCPLYTLVDLNTRGETD